jgi:hypothetical protein
MIDWKGALRKLASELGLARGKDSNSVAQHPNKPNVTLTPASLSTANRHEGTGLQPATRTTHTRPREDAGRPGTKTVTKEDKGPSKGEEKKPRQLRSASQGPFPTPEMRKYPVGYEDCDGLKAQQWQSIGASSTIGRAQAGRRSLCTVGLDFGTAFTKACVQVRNSAYVVHWDRCVSFSPPFLLPSMFSELPDGTCVLGSHTGARQYSDIKTRSDQTAAVIFIALVTRYVRAWLFTEHRSVVDGFALDWSMNVGLPASSWDSADTASLYKLLSVAGWRLGATDGPISFAMATAALASVGSRTSGQINAELIETFPEFGAQVHSYRSSSQRQRDLHLLVDVGAGTVDVVTFHIGEEDESEINCILEPIVKKLGTHILLAYRAQAGSLDGRTWTDAAARLNRGSFESSFGLRPGSLNAVQEHFSDLLHLSIRKVLHVTKSSRYETSPRWVEGVPFFLSGGGRNVDAFREAIRKTVSERNMVELSLPVPENVVLGKVAAGDFHRLSVAHGLSSSADNLAKTLRRSEVPDLRRVRTSKTDYSERYIDK